MRPSSLRLASGLPASLRQILSAPLPESSTATTVSGWIKSVRAHKSVTFLELSDGSSAETLQAVLKGKGKAVGGVEGLTLGTSVSLTGQLQNSRGSGQARELLINDLEILGASPSEDYPIQKKHLPPDVLRDHAHLRFRTAHFGALMRVRDALSREWHDYFEEKEFVHVHTPVMTSSDCEGAGEAFRITTLPSHLPPTLAGTPPPEDFYPTPAYLTVSSQLHLEAPTHSLSRTYTLSPTFRAEPSATSRHLAEFYMLEAEVAWLDEDVGKAMEQTMGTLEDGLRWVVGELLAAEDGRGKVRAQRARKDLEVVWESVMRDVEEKRSTGATEDRDVPTLNQLRKLVDKTFHKVSYTKAVEILRQRHQQTPFVHPPTWGAGLQSEHEKYLASAECFDGPMFVTDYPRPLKPFYMRVNPRQEGVPGETVACFDLLIPHIGELAGGSLREERLELLEEAVREAGLNREAYEWYLDLRKFGTVRHGGWGMGWERFVCWLTGVGNVRDVVAFPRWKGSCRY